MRIAQALAGFSLGQADVLRKAMGKKDPKVMAKMRESFMEGAKAKGINEKKATKIFDLMEYFAGYGFNKSHSTAYAFLAYQTAYLKANYPWHFAAALLTIEAQNTEKLAMYLGECRERGIPVLPPDVNESHLHFTVEKGVGVRFGLTAIKGLGEGAISAILVSRAELGGRIPTLHALCEILDMRAANKRVFEALVKSGACDSLAGADMPLRERRARLFAAIDGACEHGSRTQRDKALGQNDLFGGGEEGEAATLTVRLPDVKPWTEIEQLNFEKETLGLYFSGHPMDRWAADLKEYGAKSIADLGLKKEPEPEIESAGTEVPADDTHASRPDDGNGRRPDVNGRRPELQFAPDGARKADVQSGVEISIGGIVAGLRPLKTRKGDRMCVFMLEDTAGSIEVVVFPECFKQCGHLAENGNTLVVKGKFERDDESARIVASEIVPIEMVRERLARKVGITLSTPRHDRDTFLKLWDVIAAHKGDRPLTVTLVDTERHLRVKLDVAPQIKVRPSERLVAEVEKICGNGSVTLR